MSSNDDISLYSPFFPATWQRESLYGLADWLNGLAFKPADLGQFGLPVIKIVEIKSGLSPQTKYSSSQFDKKYLIKKGDMLFCWSGQPETSIDTFFWNGPAGWLNQHIFKVTPNSALVLPCFFYYLLKYLKPTFISIASNKQTTGLGHVTKGDLQRIQVSFPSLELQQNIVAIIKPIDDRIALLRETNTILEAIAQALFKSWFMDFDPVRAKQEGREPEGMDAATAALFPDSFEESELGLVPRGWRWSILDEISTVGIGKTPPRKEPQWFSINPEDVRWVSIRDMGVVGAYMSRTSEYLTAESIDRFNVRLVPDNTVLLSFKMTIGRVSVTDGEMTTNEAIAHFKLDEKSPLTSEFIYLYLKQFDYSTLSSTSSIADAVNSKTVKSIPILVAERKALEAFQNQVGTLFKRIKVIEQQAQTLATLRDTLLPRLISGQLRLPEVEANLEAANA